MVPTTKNLTAPPTPKLDWSKYKNGARNGFSMPKLEGKVVLHSFRCQFVFKLHFQYGRRQPFWILASHKFRRHFREGHGAKFFLNTSKSSNQVSNLTMLSVGTGPPDCTQLIVGISQSTFTPDGTKTCTHFRAIRTKYSNLTVGSAASHFLLQFTALYYTLLIVPTMWVLLLTCFLSDLSYCLKAKYMPMCFNVTVLLDIDRWPHARL